jgi:hypothetical protein
MSVLPSRLYAAGKAIANSWVNNRVNKQSCNFTGVDTCTI